MSGSNWNFDSDVNSSFNRQTPTSSQMLPEMMSHDLYSNEHHDSPSYPPKMPMASKTPTSHNHSTPGKPAADVTSQNHTPSSVFDLNSPPNQEHHHDEHHNTEFNDFLQTLLTDTSSPGNMQDSPFLDQLHRHHHHHPNSGNPSGNSSNNNNNNNNNNNTNGSVTHHDRDFDHHMQDGGDINQASPDQAADVESHQSSVAIPNGSHQSVNPNDIFRSPMLGPQASTGGPSSVTSGTNMSLFSVSMQSADDGFTPLLSPNTTPMEMARSGPIPPDFSMPASYMSPIASPSLDPQQASAPNSRRSSAASARRQSSGKTTPIMAANSRVAKMSPVLRATNKRKSSYQNTTLHQQAQQQQANSSSNSSSSNQMAEGSSGSSDSVSPPERLNEHMMPPPTNNSKSNISRRSSVSNSTVLNTPATPASLMNLPPGQNVVLPVGIDMSEEKLQRAILATNNASYTQQYAGGPRNHMRRSSSTSSMTSRTSPVSSTPPIKPKLPISRASSNWKSAKGSARSPVIKPKLSSSSASPSISPRIAPAGHNNKTTSSSASGSELLEMLAAKSNYQNIVEGNHSQLGLQYPDHLSADLTSKRTSHKLAEQGRRNRINNALAELASLISPKIPTNSKATTVENAIVYIKGLREELEDTKSKLEKYEPLEEATNESPIE